MEAAGWLSHFETAWLDSFLIMNRAQNSNVAIVYITDKDYYKLFQGRSPLDAAILSRAVSAASVGGASVIGVDLDTSDRSFRTLQIDSRWPAVIWGEEGIPNTGSMVPVPALGGRSIALTGLTEFPIDSDGVVRRYQRTFMSGSKLLPSFSWIIVKTYCARHLNLCSHIDLRDASSRTMVMRFSSLPRQSLSVGEILDAARSPYWRESRPLNDMIVLIGGSYHAGRDLVVTPLGIKPGVSLTADAIRSEFDRGPIQPLRSGIAFLLDLGIGALIVWISYGFRPRAALVITLLGIPVLAGIGSYLAFASLAKWVDFIPVTLGVFIHQLYDHGAEYRRLLHAEQYRA